jgi:hypothetical protein
LIKKYEKNGYKNEMEIKEYGIINSQKCNGELNEYEKIEKIIEKKRKYYRNEINQEDFEDIENKIKNLNIKESVFGDCTILILDKYLHKLPFESIPILKGN